MARWSIAICVNQITTYAQAHTRIHTHIYTTYTHTHIYIHTYTRIHIYIHPYTRIPNGTTEHENTCVTHLITHAQAHTHIHTHTSAEMYRGSVPWGGFGR